MRDRPWVHNVHATAFGRAAEADLTDQLRSDPGFIPELSLVAVEDNTVVGHVICTRATVDGQPALGLGPLGVLPGRQRAGVGSVLVHSVVAAADALGEPLVVLLGDPAYYRRFGFVLASEYGIVPPVAEWAPHFQARSLSSYSATLCGQFRYAAPFDLV